MLTRGGIKTIKVKYLSQALSGLYHCELKVEVEV